MELCSITFDAEICILCETDGDLHVYDLKDVRATVKRYDDGQCIRDEWSFEDENGDTLDIDFDDLSRTEQFRLEDMATRQ